MGVSTVWLTINRACNFKCKWCYTLKNLDNTKYMDFEQASSYIEFFRQNDINKIILIGGEPTIHPRFIDFIRLINSQGMSVSVATNGQAFSSMAFCEQSVSAGLSGVNISLKGVTEKQYVLNTGREGLRKAIAAYENFRRLSFGGVSFSYVITKDDLEDARGLLKTLQEIEDDDICILLQFSIPEFGTNCESEETWSLGNSVSTFYNVMKGCGIHYIMELTIPLCMVDNTVLEKLIAENRVSTCCHIAKGTGMIIDTDFCVLPCNHFNGFPYSEQPLALKKGAIHELFDTDMVKRLQSMAKCYPSNECIVCKYWGICGGGCFARWFVQNPKEVIETYKTKHIKEVI